MDRMKMVKIQLVHSLLVLMASVLIGCEMPQPRVVVEKPAQYGRDRLIGPSQSVIGHIVRVNQQHRYVIIQCEVLPSEGEEANVYSGGNSVARVRIKGPHREPFKAADILAGAPRVGDKVGMDL